MDFFFSPSQKFLDYVYQKRKEYYSISVLFEVKLGVVCKFSVPIMLLPFCEEEKKGGGGRFSIAFRAHIFVCVICCHICQIITWGDYTAVLKSSFHSIKQTEESSGIDSILNSAEDLTKIYPLFIFIF